MSEGPTPIVLCVAYVNGTIKIQTTQNEYERVTRELRTILRELIPRQEVRIEVQGIDGQRSQIPLNLHDILSRVVYTEAPP